MNKKILLAVILFLLTFAWAEEIVLDSQIHEVTVYQSQGYVKRRGTESFAKGIHTIKVKQLPYSLVPHSVQAEVLTNSAKIIGFKLSDFFNEEILPQDEKIGYEEQIENLKNEKLTIIDELAIISSTEKYIKNISDNTAKRIVVENSDFSLQNLEQVMNFSQQKLTDIKTKQRKLNRKKSELDKQIAILKQKSTSLNVPTKKSYSKMLTITFEVYEEQDVGFEISYSVPNVSWKPAYDIYVSKDEKQVALKFSASIKQLSGEDWEDVNLVISTNDPTIDMNIPKFHTWVIDKKKKPVPFISNEKKINVRGGRSNEVVYTIDGLSVNDPVNEKYGVNAFSNIGKRDTYQKERKISTIEIEQTSSNKNYKLNHKSTILSSKESSEVIVTTEILDIDVTHFLIPRQSTKSYMKAFMTNNTDYTFLGGEANIFFGNSFLTTVWLPLFLPKQKIDFSLGADEDVIVKFERIKKEEDQAFFSSKKILKMRYKLTLQNYRKETTKFIVLEQAPTADSKNVTVTILDPSIPFEERSKEDERIGKIKWILNLEPQEEKELEIGYKVKGLK